MCGIAGLIGLRPVNPAAVQTMCDQMAHRGPDADGIWQSDDRQIVLGHRRLSIIDLSEAANQPMISADGKLVLTYNGEIYNFEELRAELISLGCIFRTKSDSEVLLQGYATWGSGVLAKLNGMFAFCIVDLTRRKALFARDRFGEKPLLFAKGDGFFAFASEYKPLLGLEGINGSVDYDRLRWFFVDGRTGLDTDTGTVFAGIQQLNGGEFLELGLDNLACETSRYWWPGPDPEIARLTFEEAREAFRDLMVDSVRLRLRSDVPVGSCLSGGLDSSSIVCIARDLLGEDHPYNVFCGRFPGTNADEWPFAEQVVRATGTIPHITEPTRQKFFGELDSFIALNELPVGSASQFAQWCVFKKAKEAGVTVLLDGQGGDEILGGYEQYYRQYLLSLPPGLRDWEEKQIRERYPLALPPEGHRLRAMIPGPAKKTLARLLGKGSDLRFGLRKELPPRPSNPGILADNWTPDPLRKALTEDSFSASLPMLLRYGDRNSMAHSREVRLPFCDHRISEFACSVPPGFLMGRTQTKRLLRESMTDILPDAIRTRWNKQGFLPPQELWLKDYILECGLPDAPDWIDGKWWAKTVGRFTNGEPHLGGVIWKPFIASQWEKRFVARTARANRSMVFAPD